MRVSVNNSDNYQYLYSLVTFKWSSKGKKKLKIGCIFALQDTQVTKKVYLKIMF